MFGSQKGLLSLRDASTDEFLNLISDPFSGSLQQDAFLTALYTSLGVTGAIAVAFCCLRPFNTVVYAPRLKHADEKHAPPPIGKGFIAWVKPVITTKESALVQMIGLDATLFLRFTKMCRNLFSILTIVGCAIIIPLNVVGGNSFRNGFKDASFTSFQKMSPQYIFGTPLWGFVVVAYLFDIICCFFLWWNYRAVTRLRKEYFESYDYQNSLHARTLMITDVPKNLRSDEGLVKIVDEIRNTPSLPRGAIARNVKELPDLIEEHEHDVRKLEKVLAKYLKNPKNLGPRPMCKPSKKDSSRNADEKVDAIDYLTNRIKKLEEKIRATRETIDKRNAMSYGFASYRSIEEAHNIAYLSRSKHPQGTSVRLAPKPNDIIWKNLPMTPKERRWQKFINNLWITLLTLLWMAPNALIAVFLTNLSNLGKVWKAFDTELNAHPSAWAAVQGILSPAITSLVYYLLPRFFRRLSMRSGDLSKTSRERHVVAKLYNFFVFNNLIVFSLFAAVWSYVAAIIKAKDSNTNVFDAIVQANLLAKVVPALCNVSPFWVTWLLQRNLGAAVDLAQLVNLAWGSILRKFGSPTPREMIELTAPPPFEYASYYNYFLFYSTITLCFGALQPIVLPVTAFYFGIDYFLKKYLLMYVFVTKTESGGQFWRVLFNRFLVAMFLANCVTALLLASQSGTGTFRIQLLGCMAPLPFILIGFKLYCSKTFDDAIHYYNKGMATSVESQSLPDKKTRHADSVGARYGHPALYKPLMTPMVHAKAKDVLGQVYQGRLDNDDTASLAGYSDSYNMKPMGPSAVGKSAQSASPFELVTEGQLDFENFKNRPEFKEEFGGDGEMYGRPIDLVRPGTPGSFMTGERGRSSSRDSERTTFGPPSDHDTGGTTYPAGYHMTPHTRNFSPDGRGFGSGPITPQASNTMGESSDTNLLRGAAPMGQGPSPIGEHGYRSASPAPGMYRTGSPADSPGTASGDNSYDYFRGRR